MVLLVLYMLLCRQIVHRDPVFNFCIYPESAQVYCGKENQDAENHFCLFLVSHLSLQCNRRICVKDFSGTIVRMSLKFDVNVRYDLLYCVKENRPPASYHSLYLSIFLSLQSNFCYRLVNFYESQSLKILYTL